MIRHKLNGKVRKNLPRAVLAALNLRQGDEIAYRIEGDRVILCRATPRAATDDPFRTFTEWDSEADVVAYAGL